MKVVVADKFEKSGIDSLVLVYFRKNNIPVLANYTDDPAELDCNVPFDIVEDVAELPNLSRMNAILVSISDSWA